MSKANQIDMLLERFPLYSEELGIDLSQPSGRFKWFLASILFGELLDSGGYVRYDFSTGI